MVKRKHSIEQIIGKLRETEVELAQGRSVAEVCRSLGVALLRELVRARLGPSAA